MDVINNAVRNNVVISSLDARGLYSLTPGGNADTTPINFDPNTASVKANYERDTALANRDILEEFADATGGAFFHDNNDFAAGLKLIATQPEYIYVLGFAPQKLKLDGGYHKLNVALKNAAGLQLQARRGYFERNHLEDPAQEAMEELKETFFSRDEMRELPVVLTTQYFKTGDQKARLAILARIDAVANEDSDGDGFANLLELVTGHFPGEAGDYPVAAEVAKGRAAIATLRRAASGYRWNPFERVARPELPAIRSRAWVRNPIDRFIAAEHEARGLTPRSMGSKLVARIEATGTTGTLRSTS